MSHETVQRADGLELIVTDKQCDMLWLGVPSTSDADFAQMRIMQSGVRTAVYLDRDDARALRNRLNDMLEGSGEAPIRLGHRPCGAQAEGGWCVLEYGHNMGRLDIPQNHSAVLR